MSNTKWVKLLGALSSIDGISCKALVKLVWDEEPRDMRIDDELDFKFDYYDASMESMISGYPRGSYDYKEIEWLKLNANEQQLSIIENQLNQIAQFEMVRDSSGIQLFAYK
jgi:hypothetical protein